MGEYTEERAGFIGRGKVFWALPQVQGGGWRSKGSRYRLMPTTCVQIEDPSP